MDVAQQTLSEFNIIDNIIESAVDELLQNQVTTQTEYGEIDDVLLTLCRLCAREDESQMLEFTEDQLLLIAELNISLSIGVDETSSVCSKICHDCSAFLREIQSFCNMCLEAQKRISTLLTQRNMLPDFLKLDFTVSSKEPFLPMLLASPLLSTETKLQEDGVPAFDRATGTPSEVEDHSALEKAEPMNPRRRTENKSTSASLVSAARTVLTPGKRQLVKRAATKVSQLVKSLQSRGSKGSSEMDEGKGKNPKLKATKQRKGKVMAAGKSLNKTTDLQTQPTQRTDSRRIVVNGRLEWLCLDCEETFESCARLKSHRQTCALVGTEQSKRIGSFSCDLCDYVHSSLAALRVHRHKHSEKGTKARRKRTAIAKDETPEKICHVCGKLNKSARALRLHLLTHSNEKKNECLVCGKRFLRSQALKMHMDVHSETKQYECEMCGKRFHARAGLYNHRKTHDQSYRRRQCPVCPKRFVHPYQLREHMMIHTGEYPYVCSVCDGKYRTLAKLNRHLEKEHVQIFDHITLVEDCETNEVDDLIVYQPEEDLVPMMDTIPHELGSGQSEMATLELHPELAPAAIHLEAEGSVFVEDHHQLLNPQQSPFVVNCFPGPAPETDDAFYSFMDG
ncbi:zinc finger protein 596-like [Anopheles aquasalis]|uniref:zinc finger protein 596-like n=1 Tax=Anopheles aquasalis TaxID=42839 RepID=UPI00215A48A3|nr:zinc finger protein 596-like [Anopheles aquasalis]